MTKGRRKSPPKRGRKIVARGTPARWEVAWHPKALDEKNAIEDVAERVAIAHVIEKLEVDGPALRSPHQSGVMGEEGSACASYARGAEEVGGGPSIGGWGRSCLRFSP